MSNDVKHYAGTNISVLFDSRRCIHAAECVHGLPEVFNAGKTPWIDSNGAQPDRIAEVVSRCPTGALQYERHDGGAIESTPEINSVHIVENGPLYCRGAIEIHDIEGNLIASEQRLALCRCGASKIKPYCDGSHVQAGFKDAGSINDSRPGEDLDDLSGPLSISCRTDGPLIFKGAVRIGAADGKSKTVRKIGAFCRCGHSDNKPFCDGAHKETDFTTN